MRAVLDPNVLIAALLSPRGACAELIRRWLAGAFELVVSDELLAELTAALEYPRLRSRISRDETAAFVRLLTTSATVAPDPPGPQRRSRDPGDDYLVALAETARARLVTGDTDLLALGDGAPVESPADFLRRLT